MRDSIIVLDKTEKFLCLLSNELPKACPYWDDEASERLNEADIFFEFKVDPYHKFTEYLENENHVLYRTKHGKLRLMVIKKVELVKPDSGNDYLQIFTEHTAMDELNTGVPISPRKFSGVTIKTAGDSILQDSDWEVGTVEVTGTRTFEFTEYVTPLYGLLFLKNASQWGCDIEFNIHYDYSLNKITKRTVDFIQQRGENTGKVLEYKRNMKNFRKVKSSEEVVTALTGVGQSADGNSLVTFKDIEWRVANGDPVDKPLSQDWVGDPDAFQTWNKKGKHKFGIYTSDSKTPLELLQNTWNKLQKLKALQYTYEVSGKLLKDALDREPELGDTIFVKDVTGKVETILSARIIEENTSKSNPASDSYVLGDYEEVIGTNVDVLKNIQKTLRQVQKTFYTWVMYADDVNGAGINSSPTGKTHIGIAYNKEVPTPSTTATDYSWSLIKGDTGPQGPAGTPSYTHIAYATNSTGTTGFSTTDSVNKTYIGMYADNVVANSTDPTKYKWTLIKGADGSQGIPGPAGENGLTPYFHVAYATNSTGTTGFSTTDSLNKTYIGTYTDFTSADSTDPTKYKWVLIQGPQGLQGIPGPAGSSLYTWVKYADTPTTGMSDTPTGKKYIGLAYNKTVATESTTYADYSWSLIEGPQGVQGPAGSDGVTTYTWIKYADNANGTGMSDSPVGKRYLGLAYNKTTATESTTPSDYSWSPLYDNVKPGVRNLVKNSTFNDGIKYWSSGISNFSVLTPEADKPGSSILRISKSGVGSSTYWQTWCDAIEINADGTKEYTISVDMKTPNASLIDGTPNIFVVRTFNDTTSTAQANSVWQAVWTKNEVGLIDGQWIRFTVTIKPTTGKYLKVAPYLPMNGTMYWREIKVEQGNVASDWTPSPEEVSEKIDNVLRAPVIELSRPADSMGYTKLRFQNFVNFVEGKPLEIHVSDDKMVIQQFEPVWQTWESFSELDVNAAVRARLGIILPNGTLKGTNNESTFTFDHDGNVDKHHRIKFGKTILKSLNGTTVSMQVRNAADTGYAPISATEFVPGSRLEWKKNIEPYLDDALSELLNTELFRYHLNEDNDNELKRLGFIYEYSPVDAIDPSGYGMSLYALVTMLTRAIQQLHEQKTAEINELKAKNVELEERLQRLEAIVLNG